MIYTLLDEEEGGTRRKEGRGGRRDEELKRKVVEKMKNEKVAKGRIIGLAGPCFSFHTSLGNKKDDVLL